MKLVSFIPSASSTVLCCSASFKVDFKSHAQPQHTLESNSVFFIRTLFCHSLNDKTNAFKAYRKICLDGFRPFPSSHFNLTVKLRLKTIIRGYSFAVIPSRGEIAVTASQN
jgi:hypothetical protein